MVLEINGNIFKVELENNSLALAFYNTLPQSLKMKELNGNEKYCNISTNLPSNPCYYKTIHSGDIMLWGSNCIVIFYQTFETSYAYTKIGKILDTTKIKQCLGAGNIVVNFIK